MTLDLQPLLHDAAVTLHAPTQVWSRSDGDIGDAPIDGVFNGDVRHLSVVRVTVDDTVPEHIATDDTTASRVVFDALLRSLDDAMPDPKVRLRRERIASAGAVSETLTLRSHREEPVTTEVRVAFTAAFTPMQEVKAGAPRMRDITWTGGTASHGDCSCAIATPGADVTTEGDTLTAVWRVTVPPRGAASVSWSATLEDPSLVIAAAPDSAWARPLTLPHGADSRAQRWLNAALSDLDGLRLTLPDDATSPFFAAGAPWFFTLFGRDSLWAARLALPVDTSTALGTLRVLARLQGTEHDPATAQAPGKIAHELRSAPLELPSEGVLLPPLYYGTVDATPLWICLLADVVDRGTPLDELRTFVPALRAALGWIVDHGAASGSGFIDYVDETGHGLANQGWKDSGDSIQWRDGALADGPIALCEVQAYAYEAAVRGAELLDAFGEPGADALRVWAADLRERFHASFWVTTPEGTYPAIALDAHGAAVDTLTSNIGHLIGTGILSPEQETACAELLLSPSMSSGYGIRTMSDAAGGFWPLSYHGGSVWAHDTAIAVHGMLRAGLDDHARAIVSQLLASAEGFGYRMPELQSGDARTEVGTPIPYPAACRPQAWSAAAAVTAAVALGAVPA